MATDLTHSDAEPVDGASQPSDPWSDPRSDVSTGLPFSKFSVFLAVVRRSGPHVIEASLIPTALFYSALVVIGLGAAYITALVWLYAAVAWRMVRRRPVPPLLVLGAIGITLRTAVSLASGSSFLYFAQPVLGSMVMGCVFLVSVVIGRPMVERLALEFWPLTPEMLARPAVNRLLRGLTFLWAGTNLAIGATTLTLLLVLPLATYVAVRQVATLLITGGAIAFTIDRAVCTARREGFSHEHPAAASMLRPAMVTPSTADAEGGPAGPTSRARWSRARRAVGWLPREGARRGTRREG